MSRPSPSNSGSLPRGSASVTPCTSNVMKRCGTPCVELPLERLLADESSLVHAHEAVESGLERRVVGRQIAAPHAVGLLEAQRFHGAHAGHADAELGAGGEDRIEQMMRVLDGEVQLPAERADEVHAQQIHIRREADFGHLAGEPGKARRCPRDCRRASRAPRASAGLRPRSSRGCMVILRSVDAAVLRQHLLQVIAVVALGGAGAHHVEVLLGDLGDGEFGANAAAAGERVAERHAADLGRHLVRHQAVEPGFGARAR